MIKSWILENVILRIGDLLLRTSLAESLNEQRRISKLSEEDLYVLQQSKLNRILYHATENCAFYSQYCLKDGVDAYRWLNKFPIIHKKDVSSNIEAFIAKGFQKNELIKYESSGSTGVRSEVYLDKKEESIIRAILIHWWEWNNYYLGKPIFQTGMSPKRGWIKTLKDWLFSTTYFTAFGMDESSILMAMQEMEGKNGYILFGYASSLYELAKVTNKYKLNVHFDLVMSQGDKLFDHYSVELERAFGSKVVEDYGLNEGFMVGQKKDLPYFYVYTPNVHIEILDDNDQPVKDGEMGRIILTKLDGFAMPLIRYDSGDLGVMLPKEKYPKKRDLAFPLLEKVIGRNTDIITTSDGKKLIVHTFTGIFEFYEEILQFQVIQNFLDSILIKYIPSKQFNPEVLRKIENDIQLRTESSIQINWEMVTEIHPSKSGKPQILINNLLNNSLADIE